MNHDGISFHSFCSCILIIFGIKIFSFFFQKNSSVPTNKKITFWFATGGAGFCLSRALTLKMLPIAGGGKFINIGDRIRFPDDVTMGFIIGKIVIIHTRNKCNSCTYTHAM